MKGLDLPTVENAVIRAQVQRKGDREPAWWGPLLLAGGEWWSIAGRRFHSHELLDWELISVPAGSGSVLLTREEARIARKALLAYGYEPHLLDYDDEDEMGALVKRLEAAS